MADRWRITRLYSDAAGETHFEDVDMPLKDAGRIGRLSAGLPAGEMVLRETDGDYDWGLHNAPARQYIIMLNGETEVQTSLGDKRVFRGGDVLLVEDTEGKGHRSRSVDGVLRRSIFVTLAD